MTAATAKLSKQRIFEIASYSFLSVSGWVIVNLACVVGFYVLFFLLIGRFEFTGFVEQIANFTSRYLAADGARRASFLHIFWAASLTIFFVVALLRRHSFPKNLKGPNDV